MKLNKTQSQLIIDAAKNKNGQIFINFALATTRRSNNSFGLRERKQAQKLAALGLLQHCPELSEFDNGAGCSVYCLPCCRLSNA
jgi:hypothetical protein